jgi:hypothetical protein
MITAERHSKNEETASMLDKETIGKWIRELKLPLALYLKSNLKPSGPEWFKNGVLEHVRSNEMSRVAERSGDITSLDEIALLGVFLGNWQGISEKNNIPKSFKDTIYRMIEIRNKYIGHAGLILKINETGYKDLDTLIEFTEGIGAGELQEKFQLERDKEIIRLAKNIKSKGDSYVEPIEAKEHKAEVLSVSATETIHLIKKYLVHSCPKSYVYPETGYITFRIPPYGEMNTIYKIDKVFLIPKDVKNNLEYLESEGLNLEQMERIKNYMDRNPFTKNDRFYLLSKWKVLPKARKPKEYKNGAMLFSINQLLTGSEEE